MYQQFIGIDISKDIARLKTEIKAILFQLFPELLNKTNLFTKSILYLLLKAPIRNFKEKSIQNTNDALLLYSIPTFLKKEKSKNSNEMLFIATLNKLLRIIFAI